MNRRAWLLREAGSIAFGRGRDKKRVLLALELHDEARAVATEAAMLVAETGMRHGEAYHHVDGELCGCGLPDEAHPGPPRTVENVDAGGAL